MVPYTLSKRYQDSRTKTKKKSKLISKKDDSGDSDSDGEPVSFFSHLDKSVSDTNITVPTNSQSDSNVGLQESNFGLVSHSETSHVTHSHITSAPIAPKPFNVNGPPGYNEVPSYPEVYQTNGEPSVSLPTTIDDDQQLAESSDWYPGQYDYQGSVEETTSEVHHGPMPGAGPGLSISDEAVSKLSSVCLILLDVPLLIEYTCTMCSRVFVNVCSFVAWLVARKGRTVLRILMTSLISMKTK